MAMKIVRSSTGKTLSNKIEFFDGWKPDYPEPAFKTTNNVTYLQRRGRLEWVGEVTFAFCDSYPSSNLDRMYELIRAARRNEAFRFTDRSGDTYTVRVKNVPVQERDESRTAEYYYLDCDLLLFVGGISYE